MHAGEFGAGVSVVYNLPGFRYVRAECIVAPTSK